MSDHNRAALDVAASLLYSVGRTSAPDLDPAAVAECLLAASHLADAGAEITRSEVPARQLVATIERAARLLGQLPIAEFACGQVLDAVEATDRALLHLGR